MLEYAFEHLNCIAVEIRTDVLNTISRNAIERLGAKKDGVLRYHKIMKEGRIRNLFAMALFNQNGLKLKIIYCIKCFIMRVIIIKSNN
jgi:RimJ/RimL family protein N-acetyltransferase